MRLTVLSSEIANNNNPVVDIAEGEQILWNSDPIAWFRAGFGISGSGTGFQWVDGKNGKILGAVNTNNPDTIDPDPAANDKPTLHFPTALYVLQDETSQNLISTTGSFSVAGIFQVDASASGSNVGMISRATAGFEVMRTSAGNVRVKHDKSSGTNAAISSGTHSVSSPLDFVYSFNKGLSQTRLWVNGVLEAQNDAFGTSPTDPILALTPIGKWMDLLIWDYAVHDPAYAAVVAAMHIYGSDRYAY